MSKRFWIIILALFGALVLITAAVKMLLQLRVDVQLQSEDLDKQFTREEREAVEQAEREEAIRQQQEDEQQRQRQTKEPVIGE